MKITSQIKKINAIFSNFFSDEKNKYAFEQNNTRSISIQILALLNAFTGKTQGDLRDTLKNYNDRYVEMIDCMFLTEDKFYQSLFIVSGFVKEDIFEIPTVEEYQYIFNRPLIDKLANSIFSLSYKEQENFEFRKKMSIFITLYYLISSEYSKDTIKIFEIFKGDRYFEDKIVFDIQTSFSKELDILFGRKQEHENYLLFNFSQIEDKIFLSIADENHPMKEFDTIENSLIFSIIEKKKLTSFSEMIVDKYINIQTEKSVNAMTEIILKILNMVIKERI